MEMRGFKFVEGLSLLVSLVSLIMHYFLLCNERNSYSITYFFQIKMSDLYKYNKLLHFLQLCCGAHSVPLMITLFT